MKVAPEGVSVILIPPDWSRLLKAPSAALWECVAISCDVEPKCLSTGGGINSAEALRSSTHLEFAERLELAKDQVRVGGALHPYLLEREQRLLVCRLPLWRFGTWAAALPWRLPEKFPRVAPLAVMVPEPDARSGATWPLRKPKRDDGLALPLYGVLEAARVAGLPRPTARDAMRDLRASEAGNVLEVLSEEVKFYDSNGDVKCADLESIRKRIERMSRR